MEYQPQPAPYAMADIPAYLHRELADISAHASRGQAKTLEVKNVAPAKPREGMMLVADGTNWNPGSGKGVYCYYGAAWHFLG